MNLRNNRYVRFALKSPTGGNFAVMVLIASVSWLIITMMAANEMETPVPLNPKIKYEKGQFEFQKYHTISSGRLYRNYVAPAIFDTEDGRKIEINCEPMPPQNECLYNGRVDFWHSDLSTGWIANKTMEIGYYIHDETNVLLYGATDKQVFFNIENRTKEINSSVVSSGRSSGFGRHPRQKSWLELILLGYVATLFSGLFIFCGPVPLILKLIYGKPSEE